MRTERLLNQVSLAARSAARMLGKDVEARVEGRGCSTRPWSAASSRRLLHLVRNAIDHGIEPADVRARRGKPARGTAAVTVVQTDAAVQVEVRKDDGGGVDFARLREVLRRRSRAPRPSTTPSSSRTCSRTGSRRAAASARSRPGRRGLDIVAREIGALGGRYGSTRSPGSARRSCSWCRRTCTARRWSPSPAGASGARCRRTPCTRSCCWRTRSSCAPPRGRARAPGPAAPARQRAPPYALGAVLGDGGRPEPGTRRSCCTTPRACSRVSVDALREPRLVALVRSEEMPSPRRSCAGWRRRRTAGRCCPDAERLLQRTPGRRRDAPPPPPPSRSGSRLALVWRTRPSRGSCSAASWWSMACAWRRRATGGRGCARRGRRRPTWC